MIEPVLKDDAFLADVAAHRGESGTVRLWWLGQSGFLMQTHSGHLLFDPYLSDSLTRKYAATDKPHVRMTDRVVAPERLDFINIITSTHNHTDHLDAETLVPIAASVVARCEAIDGLPGEELMPHLVLPAANVEFARQRLGMEWWNLRPMHAWQPETLGRFEITAVPAAHDQLVTNDKGEHHYLGFVVRHRRWTVYHSGDTVVYDGMAEGLRPFNVDVAILPINGKVGNMGGRDAARLAHDIGAKLVIPCHYEMFEFNTADPRDEFIPECERLGQPYKVLRAGERLTLGA